MAMGRSLALFNALNHGVNNGISSFSRSQVLAIGYLRHTLPAHRVDVQLAQVQHDVRFRLSAVLLFVRQCRKS